MPINWDLFFFCCLNIKYLHNDLVTWIWLWDNYSWRRCNFLVMSWRFCNTVATKFKPTGLSFLKLILPLFPRQCYLYLSPEEEANHVCVLFLGLWVFFGLFFFQVLWINILQICCASQMYADLHRMRINSCKAWAILLVMQGQKYWLLSH